jgi:predicted permease
MIAALARFFARLAALFRARRLDHAVEDDLAAHVDLMADDLVAGGMEPSAARREARLRLGNVASAVDAHRTARSFGWLDDAWRDVGYAVRTLGRAPGFTSAAVATLALGIGGVTLMYSVIHHVLVAPFPYRDAERIVRVFVAFGDSGMRPDVTADEFLDFQEQSDVFEGAVAADDDSAHLLGEGLAERVEIVRGTPEMFRYLGVQPERGRHFGPPDAEPHAPPVAVLNHRTWTALFGGDPEVVGRTIRLDGEPRTIIGVMPPRFEWHDADFWLPAAAPRRTSPGTADSNRVGQFYARLRPGVTVEAARERLNAVLQRRVTASPQEYPRPNTRAEVRALIDDTVFDFRAVLYQLFSAVGLLLFIACGNVANMLLARATARERETAVRAALGATRWRLVRQLFVESLALAFGGVVCGALLASVGIGIVQGWMANLEVPAEARLRLDLPVLMFATSAGLLATLFFGLYPALHGARRDLVAGATSSSRSSTASRRHHRLRGSLVVVEVALSLVLVTGAGLFVRSFLNRTDFELGFDHRKIFMTGFAFPPGPQFDGQREVFYRETLDRVARIPGVDAVAIVSTIPPFGYGQTSPVTLPGTANDGQTRALLQFCSEGLPYTLGLRVTAGRGLSAADVAGARTVALVNETLVRQYFGRENPLGRLVRIDKLPAPTTAAEPLFEVVGVVQDAANSGIRQPADPEIYVPHTLSSAGNRRLLVRSSINPARLTVAVRESVRAVNSTVALNRPGPLQAQVESSWPVSNGERFRIVVLAGFAMTGLGLLSFGVYGVIAYTVSQQTREFAIRLALGGERRHVASQVFRTTFWLVGTGALIGLGVCLATGRVLASQLYETSPRDPITFAAALGVIVLTGAVACAVPARRAMRVEPAIALRHDE